MAFQYAKNNRRGSPRVIRLEGKWTALREYFTDAEKFVQAERFCEELNSPIRSLLRRVRGRK